MSTPYARATSGISARDEITKLLRRFGCEQIGFMDDYAEHAVMLQFNHRGREMRLRASAKGWAALWLKENPYSGYRKGNENEHRAKALAQGHVAINSILRDWVKGQLMAVETGMLSFDAVFLPFAITHDGRTVAERAEQLGLLTAGAEP